MLFLMVVEGGARAAAAAARVMFLFDVVRHCALYIYRKAAGIQEENNGFCRVRLIEHVTYVEAFTMPPCYMRHAAEH